ncbi:hypothetical protein LA733_2908 [Leptospira interrogans]|nr:hypothetical protein LEP1GSC053_0198 [Leptospira interrogans serovar Muenchen str. Brem 129]KWV23012.1 hypothetical protein LA733_2908 [Leptospira interrogans]KWV24647.1 hypothetical protein LA702_2805 [Leptospira interrogans]
MSFFYFSQSKPKSYRFKKYFSTEDLEKIESAVSKSEILHKGEIKVILESGLSVFRIIEGLTTKQRAEELFSQKKNLGHGRKYRNFNIYSIDRS